MKAIDAVETVKSGALKIEVRKYADGRFGFDYKPPGEERVKVRKKDLDDACKMAEKLIGTTHAGKLDLLSIDPDMFARFLRWEAQNRKTARVPALVVDFINTKKTKGRTDKHIDDLEGTLTEFAKMFTGFIDAVQAADVEDWINSRDVGPRTWNNIRSRVISLWIFARRRGAIGREETPVEQIERKKTTTKKETYTLAEFKLYLGSMKPQWLPFIIIGGLTGIRPEEICPDLKSAKAPLKWENFLWAKRVIDVQAETSKVGERRHVPLNDAALAFLAPWRDAKGFCVPRMKVNDMTARWGRAVKVPWKFDGWRHSYASYRLAVSKDMAALEDEMGNSRKMIKDHYLDRKFEHEGVEWFALRPSDIKWLHRETAELYSTKAIKAIA